MDPVSGGSPTGNSAGVEGSRQPGAGERIRREVSSWPGVVVAPHRFGGLEYRVGRRELGHVHGDRLADLPFPMRLRNELVAAGRARPHHILPDTGWVSCFMRTADDAAGVVELFRLNYERPWLGSSDTARI